ncbi:MAG: nucleoside diphosphate kinase regulator [Rhizobiales bacterium]|nr:nucleoside diphosphate kinase regulator [Hyphomicrobiales bacterium]OJY44923.1 MAG: nucleoside-diphosphate kinase [Rhizobiales bacterium 64-17]
MNHLPNITLTTDDSERLRRLADAASEKFPRTAEFLAREVDRATVIDDGGASSNLVTMGAQVVYRDDDTGKTRSVIVVYPDEANLDDGKISVLTPIGAALIGLSVNQSIEFETPTGATRSLTVMSVRKPG